MRSAKTALSALLALAFPLLLAGCGDPLIEPVSPKADQPCVAASARQKAEDRIIGGLQKLGDKGFHGLSALVSGPEYQIRKSQMEVEKATGKPDEAMDIPYSVSAAFLPSSCAWPRSITVLTGPTNGQYAQRLLTFTQDSPRTNYTLWSMAELFPGVQLPFKERGNERVGTGSLSDLGLAATPRSALSQYADVLEEGPKSPYISHFETGDLYLKLQELKSYFSSALTASGGSQSESFYPQYSSAKVLKLKEGDLVIAQIDSEWVRIAGKDGEAKPATPAEKALFKSKPSKILVAKYVNVVAMFIPSATKSTKIEVLGAEREPISVEAR